MEGKNTYAGSAFSFSHPIYAYYLRPTSPAPSLSYLRSTIGSHSRHSFPLSTLSFLSREEFGVFSHRLDRIEHSMRSTGQRLDQIEHSMRSTGQPIGRIERSVHHTCQRIYLIEPSTRHARNTPLGNRSNGTRHSMRQQHRSATRSNRTTRTTTSGQRLDPVLGKLRTTKQPFR